VYVSNGEEIMTRKDYVAIAEIIDFQREWADKHPTFAKEIPHQIAYRLADYFAANNPRFSFEKFLNACGVGCDYVR
jgi:hypothetical protein